jgi:hypothetical protein
MDMKSVDSSLITAVGYDADNKKLAVKFKSGSTYNYSGVDQGTYDAMMKAESIGKHFGTNIRGKFSHTLA